MRKLGLILLSMTILLSACSTPAGVRGPTETEKELATVVHKVLALVKW